MRKKEFIKRLRQEIRTLSYREQEDIINYYSELIDDRIENGEREEDVIVSLGSIDIIVSEIMSDRNKASDNIKYSPRPTKKVSSGVGKIIIIILLFPVWIVIGSILFALIVAIASSSIALCFSGVFYLIGSIIHIIKDFYVGIIQLGLSLIILAIGLLLLKYGFRLISFLIKKIKSLFGMIFNNQGVVTNE